jgi:hypothetical protein
MRHIVFLLLFLAILAATSCTRHVYVPVETTKSDTVYLNRVQLDSIYMRDSVFIENDTGVPIQVHIQVQGQNRYAVYIQDGQHTSTLPRRGSKVQDSPMVLVGSRCHCLAACPLHHEMDNKIERTGFLDII